MTTVQAIILGIIQGLTEFLPVSSSGHLVLFSQLFNVQGSSLVFEVMVHVGTLLAVLVVFRADVWSLVVAFFKLLRKPRDAKRLVNEDPGVRLLMAIVLGTIPAVVVGLLLKEQIEQLFRSSLLVGFMLIVTGTILYVTERYKVTVKGLAKMSIKDAVIIGCGQAVAIIPGISRSGTTIAVGLFRGLDRESAARFSFLLAIPTILGALVLSLEELFLGTTVINLGVLAAGFVAAAVTGYLAIHLLLDAVKKGRLTWFSYYTWAVGALVIALHLM